MPGTRDLLVLDQHGMHGKLLTQMEPNCGCHARPQFRFVQWALLLVFAMLLSSRAFGKEGSAELIKLVGALEGVNHGTRAALVRERYWKHHVPGAALDSDALLDWFKAAEIAAFYTHDSRIAKEVERAYLQLRGKGLATASHAEAVLGSLIIARDFDAAWAFNLGNS